MTCSVSSNTDTTMTSQEKGQYHGRGQEGHIRRPSNAFILYRSDLIRKDVLPPHTTQQDKSRIAAVCWKQLPPAEVTQWKNRAKELKEEHYRRYPDFKYNPTPKGPIKRRRQARSKETQLQDCNALFLKYFPDKAVPIPGNNTPLPCRGKRRSYHKSGSTSQSSPVGQESVATSSSCQYEKNLLDPLILPPSANAEASGSLSSDWGQQTEEPRISSSLFGEPHPVKNSFPCHTALALPDDWSCPCPPKTFQSAMDTLEQLTNPTLPPHSFEESQYRPSTALLPCPVHEYTYSLPPVSLTYASPMTLGKSYTDVDRTYQSTACSKGTDVPAPAAPRPEPMHEFSYLNQHPQGQHLQLHQQQFTNDDSIAILPQDEEPGLFSSVLDSTSATDIGIGMGMRMDMRMRVGTGKKRTDWGWGGNGNEFGDGMGHATGARTYHGGEGRYY